MIHTGVVRTFDEVRDRCVQWVAGETAEGVTLRADGRTSKVKPEHHLDAVVVGYTQRGEDEAQASSLLLALVRAPGQLQLIGSCGNLGFESARRAPSPVWHRARACRPCGTPHSTVTSTGSSRRSSSSRCG